MTYSEFKKSRGIVDRAGAKPNKIDGLSAEEQPCQGPPPNFGYGKEPEKPVNKPPEGN